MPTEYKPGKQNFPTPESFVEVLSSSNSVAIKPPVTKIQPTPEQLRPKPSASRVTPKPTKKSILGNIASFFLNDFLWFLVALVFLFVAIFFYFQFLQPVVLRKYIDTAQAQIIEANQRLYKQLNSVSETQKNIFLSIRKSPSESCTEGSKYNNYKRDQQNIDSLSSTLTVDSKIKQLPNFLVYSDNKVQNIYYSFVKEYSLYLQDFQPTITQLTEVIDFENYKDSLIDNCIDIKNSKGDTEELKAICKDQNNRAAQYLKTGSVTITNSLSKYTDNLKLLCSALNESNSTTYPPYNSFLLKFLSEIDNIQAIKINQVSQSNANILESFNMVSTKYKNQLDQIYEGRQDFAKIWYLLKITLR
jgi:hypothetical protein